jgi:hypothetical protein
MKLLELFSGTHSIGKIAKEKGYEVYSLDRDLGAECPLKSGYKSDNHFKEDIMTFDYKQFPKGYFKVITASPVCLWWSVLRNTWIGRKLKSHGDTIITKEILEEDIKKYGEPMVDKIFEIIDYLEPQYWWIENPQTGRMKEYINDLVPYHDVDYCKYSDWGYKKTTRFWTNIENFKPKICKKDCENIISYNQQKLHKNRIGNNKNDITMDNDKIIRINTAELRKKFKHKKDISVSFGGGSNRLERYRKKRDNS